MQIKNNKKSVGHIERTHKICLGTTEYFNESRGILYFVLDLVVINTNKIFDSLGIDTWI